MDMISKVKNCTPKFALSMGLFLILMAIQSVTMATFELSLVPKVIITLIPILPLFWAFAIYRRYYLRQDEYMRGRIGEAFMWILATLCFVSYTYGMLMYKFEIPAINPAFILPVVFGCHGLVVELLVKRDSHEE